MHATPRRMTSAPCKVHDDGVRHPLPIVGDEGTGCEALGVVREIHVRGSGRPAQDAQAAVSVSDELPKVLMYMYSFDPATGEPWADS